MLKWGEYMKNKFVLQAIADGFLASVNIAINCRLVLSVNYYFALAYAILISIALSFIFFNFIKKLETNKTKILFSIISFFSFVAFWVIILGVGLYFPLNASLERNPDASDGVGILLVGATFLVSSFICRFIALQKGLKN